MTELSNDIDFISVILPTYNEKENISPLIDEISRLLSSENFEIVVVDDNSPDLTWKIVEEKAVLNQNVRLLKRVDKRGLTSAILDGVEFARGDVVAWLDCDFQHPPEKLLDLFQALRAGNDVVIGSRFIESAGDLRVNRKNSVSGIIRVHGFLSVIISRFTSLVLHSPTTDWTSGLIALRKKVFESVTVEGDYGEYFMVLMYRAHKAGFRIHEVPYTLNLRERGHSKTSDGYWGLFRKGIKYIMVVFKLALGGKI